MNKLMNDSKDYVLEMLKGIKRSTKGLGIHPEMFVIYNKHNDKKKVNLISGGGAGHEPAHTGYVGKGMLDAAVSGHIFASPNPDQIKKAIDILEAQDILLIIKNYTKDVMNFLIAADIAKDEGKKIEYVIVDDDIAIENSKRTKGKRGVAGTVFVHKIAGAAASDGKSLNEVKQIAKKVIANSKSICVGLQSCINPINGKVSLDLKTDQMELGVGIHGEPGISKEKIVPVRMIVAKMLEKILASHNFKNKEVAVMVNGMGGTPLSELYIAQNNLSRFLKKENIQVYEYFVGNFMTSLDMKGFSITILELDKELKKYLDHPAHTIGFKK